MKQPGCFDHNLDAGQENQSEHVAWCKQLESSSSWVIGLVALVYHTLDVTATMA